MTNSIELSHQEIGRCLKTATGRSEGEGREREASPYSSDFQKTKKNPKKSKKARKNS